MVKVKNSSKVLGILKTFFREGFKAEGKMKKSILPLLAMILMISLCSCAVPSGRPGESSSRSDRTEPAGTSGAGTALPAETAFAGSPHSAGSIMSGRRC